MSHGRLDLHLDCFIFERFLIRLSSANICPPFCLIYLCSTNVTDERSKYAHRRKGTYTTVRTQFAYWERAKLSGQTEAVVDTNLVIAPVVPHTDSVSPCALPVAVINSALSNCDRLQRLADGPIS